MFKENTMPIVMNVVKQVSENKVLVSEKITTKNNSSEKFYIVNEDKVDRFIKVKKQNRSFNAFQQVMSFMLAPAAGILVALKTPVNKAVKVPIGIALTACSYFLLNLVDKQFDQITNNINNNECNAQEISKEDVEKM